MTGRAAAVAVGVIVLLAPACGTDNGFPAAPAPPTASTATTAPPTGVGGRGGLFVRVEERQLAGVAATVVRPNEAGPYPLVVFVHGAGAPPLYYEPLLREVAEGGNVVVAPSMPGSVDRSDFSALLSLPFQPGRVRDVIDAVTTGPQAIEVIDPERVVVMGHSLGAMASLAVGYNSCCQDGRVDAVVSIAGELATFDGGTFSERSAPVLLVHGDRDATVPYSGSTEALQQVGSSAYLLTVEGGDHGAHLGPGPETYPVVVAAVLAFLRATVGGDPSGGLADLRAAGVRSGVQLRTRE